MKKLTLKSYKPYYFLILLLFLLCTSFLTGCDFIQQTNKDTYNVIFKDGSEILYNFNLTKDSVFPDKTANKDGYNFIGWDIDGDGEKDKLPQTVTSNITLFAIFEKIETKMCTYNFIFNGQDNIFTAPIGTAIPIINVETNDNQAYHYEFIGWDANDDGLPETFPYVLNGDVTFKVLVKETLKEYTYKIIDNDEVIKEESLPYGSVITYPSLTYKVVDGKYYFFTGWKYQGYDYGYISELKENLIIYPEYTDTQILVIHLNGNTNVKLVSEGNDLGIDDISHNVTWYTNEECTDLLNSTKMPKGNLEIFGEYDKIEITNPLYDYDYKKVLYLYSKDDLVMYVNSLLFNRVEYSEVTLKFDFNQSIFSEIQPLINSFRSYSYQLGLKGDTMSFTITYNGEPSLTTNLFMQNQLPFINNYSFTKTRTDDFDNFKINSSSKSCYAVDSDSLFYILMNGYKPIIDEENQELINLYNKMKSVLRNIVDDNMTDIEKLYAIYVYLIDTVVYDTKMIEYMNDPSISINNYNSFYLEGVFNDKLAVCDGISKSFAALANMEGITCIRDNGHSVKDGITHSWNKVYVDGKWYIIDATSGGIIVDNTEQFTSTFFMIDTNTFNKYYVSDNQEVQKYECNDIYDIYNTLNLSFNAIEEAQNIFNEIVSKASTNCTFELCFNFDVADPVALLQTLIDNSPIQANYSYLVLSSNDKLVLNIKIVEK